MVRQQVSASAPSKKLNDALRAQNGAGRHKDKRTDLDERIEHEGLREFLKNLRKRRSTETGRQIGSERLDGMPKEVRDDDAG